MNLNLDQEIELISLDDMCEILSIGKNRAYEMLNNKDIKAFRIGNVWKIPRRAINQFIIERAKL